MDDYYEYAPRKLPGVPICLVGFMGSRTNEVASLIAQLTGLRLTDIDRRIEHDTGRSLAHTFMDSGECEVRRLEKKILAKALEDVPPGVIALGNGVLIDRQNQDQINSKSILVYIEYDPESLLARIQQEMIKFPAKYPEFVLSTPILVEDIKPLLETRLPGYRRADYTIVGGDKSISSLAREIIRTANL